MTNEEIFELLERFQSSGIFELKIARGDFSVEMKKAAPAAAPAAPVTAAASAQIVVAEEPKDDGLYIKAPMVGTFYVASSPDAEPYAVPGRTVKAGETVCLMEAMKMMSEVPAPCDCVIEQCMQENGTLVSFDAPLFRYRLV